MTSVVQAPQSPETHCRGMRRSMESPTESRLALGSADANRSGPAGVLMKRTDILEEDKGNEGGDDEGEGAQLSGDVRREREDRGGRKGIGMVGANAMFDMVMACDV